MSSTHPWLYMVARAKGAIRPASHSWLDVPAFGLSVYAPSSCKMLFNKFDPLLERPRIRSEFNAKVVVTLEARHHSLGYGKSYRRLRLDTLDKLLERNRATQVKQHVHTQVSRITLRPLRSVLLSPTVTSYFRAKPTCIPLRKAMSAKKINERTFRDINQRWILDKRIFARNGIEVDSSSVTQFSRMLL